MTETSRHAMIKLGACLLAIALPCTAGAQTENSNRTPKSWNYQVDSRGNRIARDNRVTNRDGSWREEIRQGNCLTIKQRAASGEYKEVRQCSPIKSD